MDRSVVCDYYRTISVAGSPVDEMLSSNLAGQALCHHWTVAAPIDPPAREGLTPVTPVTPVERAVVAVRRSILDGSYLPGQRLTEGTLATVLGVSRTTVREALRVLDSQGFVSVQPYFGTFVRGLTGAEARDLLEVQGALEPLAAALAATRRSDEQLRALQGVVEEGRRAAAAGDAGDASALHGRFHTVLATASGNASLLELMVALRYKLDWAYASSVHRGPGDSWDEHAAIVAAIERSDGDGARRAALDHIERGVGAAVLNADP